MKKLTSIFVSLCLLCVLIAGCTSSADTSTSDAGAGSSTGEDVIRIAFFAPLTGNSMQYGVSFQNAINMKVSEINKAGGIDGKQIEIVAYDDKNDPKEAVNIANKIVSDPSIKAAIGSFSSSCSMAAAPVFDEAGVLHLGPTASHPDFVSMGEKSFTIAMPMKFEGAADADYAYQKTGGKDIALIYLNSDYGVSHSSVFKESYEALGGKVVAFEEFIPGQTKDFTPVITKIKQANPGALFVIADYSDGFPANAYDCITLISGMIDKVGYDADALAQEFRQTGRYEGVSGNITIDPETKEVKRDLMVYTIADGKYAVEEIVPAT